MLKRALHLWVWSGVHFTLGSNITPTRLTNIVALLVITVSFCQMPVAIWFWQDAGLHELSIISLTIVLLIFIPVINAKGYALLAKVLLMTVYAADIIAQCMLWQINLNIHYFYLLAVFICPFFFAESQAVYRWLAMLSYAMLFMLSESYYQWQFDNEHSLHQEIFKFASACLLTFATILCSFHMHKNVSRSWAKLAKEQKRSEQLLLNILPTRIAQKLKNQDSQQVVEHFPLVSIMFTDIQNFTQLCSTLEPEKLIDSLDELFCQFDNLVEHYKLEKIKTIGDGYMAACGVPNEDPQHAVQCCLCALDMQQVFQQFALHHQYKIGLRIGIGCGEVIAGVIGKKKFSYDMWGEAVNLASRMESHGQAHKIQTTQSTYNLTKHLFNFIERGQIQVKGIGKVTTYWLVSRKA